MDQVRQDQVSKQIQVYLSGGGRLFDYFVI